MPPPTPTPCIECWIYKITVTYCWFSFMYYEEYISKKNKKRVHCIFILTQPAIRLFLFFVNNLRDIWVICSLSTALFIFRWSISEDHKIERKELSANAPQSLLKYNAAIAGSATTNNRRKCISTWHKIYHGKRLEMLEITNVKSTKSWIVQKVMDRKLNKALPVIHYIPYITFTSQESPQIKPLAANHMSTKLHIIWISCSKLIVK